MKIGVLGAGMMAEALAGRWVKAGHEVFVGGRVPQKARALSERIGAAGSGTLRQAAEFGDVVLVAVKRDGLAEMLAAAGADDGAGGGTLSGKVVIDCGNAVDRADYSRITWDGRSMAEELARLAPGSRVVKAFNLAHADVWRLDPPSYGGRPLVVPIAGDEAGKSVVRELVADLGCVPLDVGDISQTHHLEAAAVLVVRQLFSGAEPHTTLAFMSSDQLAGAS